SLASSDATSGVATIYYQFVNHGAAAPSNTLPGSWTTYSSAFTATNADKDLYGFSVDNAGNKETPVNLGEIKVDGVAPTAPGSLPATKGATGTGLVTVGWTASTDATSGIGSYVVTATDTTSGAGSQTSPTLSSGATSWQCTCVSADKYDFTVTASDNAGN